MATMVAIPAPAVGQAEDGDVPVAGEAGPGLGGVDRAVIAAMRRYEIPGASLAVARNGSLVLARGYGWADREHRGPVRPETLFALASVSKSLTAVAILKLVERGAFDLDARVFDLLGDVRPLPGDTPDPRLSRITVRHLLYHTGGWDRARSGDPNSFSERVAERMKVPLPITPEQLTRYMMGLRLDFDPGTRRRYSNFGYILLGMIVEKVEGRPYGPAMRQLTLEPLGLERIRLNRPRGSGYLPGEAHRYGPAGVEDRQAGHLRITLASGGWLATPTEMVRFLTALDGSRGERFLPERLYRTMLAPPPPPAEHRPDGGHFGMGWDQVRETPRGVSYRKNGGLLGVHSWLEHRDDGLDWALFWNGGRVEDDDKKPVLADVVRRVGDAMTEIRSWPEVDLFGASGGRPAGARGRR
jgi:N-acyl-D-amino-acid deacylase